MEAQVERDADVVRCMAVHSAILRLRKRVHSRIALHMARIYRPLTATESSARQRVRERRTRQLVANPSDGMCASVVYRQWAEANPDKQSHTAIRELEDVAEKYMEHALDPWRTAAGAIVRHRYSEAYEFRDMLDERLARAQYATDKAREAASLLIAGGARALLCTTATVGTAMRTQRAELGPLLKRLSTLVCDEAGTLADRHIVPVLASANVSRLVMIGDPAQLSCFTYVRGKPPVSAMQRLLDAGMPSVILTEQYRMPPALCDVVSGLFYSNQLVTAAGRDVVGVAAPVRFIPAHRGRAGPPRDGGTSVENLEEVRLVAQETHRLLGKYGAGTDLAVLTTYGAQRKALEKALDGVRVLTVDSSQGQEFDHVILSIVTSDKNRLGFVKDVHRLCVGLSRAKRSLVLVAHPDVVAAIPALKTLRAAAFEDSDSTRRMVVAALRKGNGRVEPTAFRVCCVCQDPISNAVGFLECDPPGNFVHALCPDCADQHLLSRLEADGFDGELRCPCAPELAGGCLSGPFRAVRTADSNRPLLCFF